MTQTKDAFDRADPNLLADLCRTIGLGKLLRGQVPQQLRRKHPAADVSQLATMQSFALPNDAKASQILRAYARATSGGGTLGELAVQAANASPADSQIAVAPNGDIVTVATSNYEQVDVTYIPCRGDVVTLTGQQVAANVFTIPAALTTRGVIYLLACAAVTGTVTGNNIIVAPGGVSVTTVQANLNAAKTLVQFVVADAVTTCNVTFLVAAASDLDTILESTDVL